MKDSVDTLIQQFKEKIGLYTDCKDRVADLIHQVLNENNIPVHSISSRVKSEESFRRKAEKTEGKYMDVEQVTDIAGLRVITYFDDDVDKVAELIQQEFQIDRENSVDKRLLLDPDRFGYLSLHYVATLSEGRVQFIEYRRFEDIKFEIQIRSILQHAWAEIEHDLGYKSVQAIPTEVRRRFSRLAGLLEIADNEFSQLRNILKEYEHRVSTQVTDFPSLVPIDQASIQAYIRSSSLVIEIDESIASLSGIPLQEDPSYAGSVAIRLRYVGLETIDQVDKQLKLHKELILAYVIALGKVSIRYVIRGACITGLANITVAQSGSVDDVAQYLQDVASSKPDTERARKMAKNVLRSYKTAASAISSLDSP